MAGLLGAKIGGKGVAVVNLSNEGVAATHIITLLVSIIMGIGNGRLFILRW
jgi:hypothetical protein